MEPVRKVINGTVINSPPRATAPVNHRMTGDDTKTEESDEEIEITETEELIARLRHENEKLRTDKMEQEREIKMERYEMNARMEQMERSMKEQMERELQRSNAALQHQERLTPPHERE